MYLLIFIQLYSFSNYIRRKTRSRFFSIPELSSVLILSGLEFLNAVTVRKFLKLEIDIEKFELVAFISIFIFNYFYFLHRKRYDKMMKMKVFKDSAEIYSMMGLIAYIVLTILFFLLVV